jgi:polysaccharide deacetylase family protein (PEP-CTERM system associated)
MSVPVEPLIVDALSFDLEDWLHVLGVDGLAAPESWCDLPSIVDCATGMILDDLDEFGVRATFFVLGWIARRYPRTIREIARRGHEIGSHSDVHRPVYSLTPKAFGADLLRSVRAIEAASGQSPRGFRAPSFSIVPGCEWAFDVLLDAGFHYDASLFPARRAHGGYPSRPEPHWRVTPRGRRLAELPMSTMRILGMRTGFSGGGYLRLFPVGLVREGFRQAHAAQRAVVVYLHPQDLATDLPSTHMPLHRRVRSRIGHRGARRKLRGLLGTYRFETCEEVLARALDGASPCSTEAC